MSKKKITEKESKFLQDIEYEMTAAESMDSYKRDILSLVGKDMSDTEHFFAVGFLYPFADCFSLIALKEHYEKPPSNAFKQAGKYSKLKDIDDLEYWKAIGIFSRKEHDKALSKWRLKRRKQEERDAKRKK